MLLGMYREVRRACVLDCERLVWHVCMYFVFLLIVIYVYCMLCLVFFFFQAEDGIRDLVRSRGLGDVYKRQRKGILRVPMKAFNEQQTLLVQTYNYKEPLILIRKKEGEVKALLMRCTHKGVGLEKIGEQLVCPAHGSIFDFDGKVLQSPAGEALTSFPAVADEKTVLVKIEQ